MNRSVLLLVLSFVVGCSRPVSSQAVGFEYEPPSGMKLVSEEAGPPAVARFEDGLEVRSVQAKGPAVEAPAEEVFAAAGVPVPGTVLTSTPGALPAGPVARYELQRNGSRTLVYYLPRPERFLLITFTAPERDFGPRSARVERSLSSLKLLR